MNEHDVIRLPSEPKGRDFEHLAASLFPATGLFIEKNITQKLEYQELQELDVAASTWKDEEPFRMVVEAKSGKWRTETLFALAGKVQYLGLDAAVLLCNATSEHRGLSDQASERFRKLGVSLCELDPHSKPQTLAEAVAALCEVDPDELVRRYEQTRSLEAWRYSFWIERLLLEELFKAAKRDDREGSVYREAKTFRSDLDRAYFEGDCREQSFVLRHCHDESPQLTRRAILRELQRQDSELHGLSEKEAFRRCWDYGVCPSVQACMLLEHWNRLLTLKASVDLVLHKRKGSLPPATWFGIELEDLLPSSQQSFVASYLQSDYVKFLPQFWQQYIFGWGGFVIETEEEREYEMMSIESGLSSAQVRDALNAFDNLFHRPYKSWHYHLPKTELRILTHVPTAFRGLGVQRRRWLFGDAYPENCSRATSETLYHWQKAGYELLARSSEQE